MLKEGSNATFTFNFWIGDMERKYYEKNSFHLFSNPNYNDRYTRLSDLNSGTSSLELRVGQDPNPPLLQIYENLGIDYKINHNNGEIKLPTKIVSGNDYINIFGVFNFPDVLLYGNKYYHEEKNINYSNELKGCYKIFESQFDKNYNLDQISKIKNFNIITRSMINNQTYGDFFKEQ